MIRICSSLASAGYKVTLTGRKLPESKPLTNQPFQQKRIFCFFKKGKAFYLEYNVRLFFFLLFKKSDLICAIDLDTILPVYFVSKIKGTKRVYDAHELFCEMKEVVTRPRIYRIWKRVEKYTVPKFTNGYTVSHPIAEEFKKMYGVDYPVISNVPVLRALDIPLKKEKYILYQGAVNEGRCFESLIPAMKEIDARLVIAGDGNFMSQARELVKKYNLEDKVSFPGKFSPDELFEYTRNAWIGITLFENKGLSNYFSLANRFFDYINAGIPQLCSDFPVYREINKNTRIAVLISEITVQNIIQNINSLLENEPLYLELQQNCLEARKQFNWQNEEKKLLSFYNDLLKN
ncbi:MAG: glycosyltransferase family 4 protein [Chitinophagaceae bacterium]|nr:glycosyltransferase family 4 protein [Chitinophagaceae bacterium]